MTDRNGATPPRENLRLFAAVYPSEQAAGELQAALTHLHARPLAGVPVQWEPSEDWHVTLAFFGTVPAADVDTLAARLAALAAAHPPPRIALSAGGCFGERALWAGLSGETAALERIAVEAAAAGQAVGVTPPERPFVPHLTVARIPAPPRGRRSLRPGEPRTTTAGPGPGRRPRWAGPRGDSGVSGSWPRQKPVHDSVRRAVDGLVRGLMPFQGTPFAAERLHLVRSQPGDGGRYRSLQSWAFTGPIRR